MQEREIRVLALNPGSRHVGIAIFHGQELVEWAIRSFREKSVETKTRKLMALLDEIADKHKTNCLAIKELHPARSSKQLQGLNKELEAWAIKRNLAVTGYTIKEMEESLLSPERRNKLSLMKEVAARYPFLYPEFDKERKNRSPYSVRMFEAVAMGIECVDDQERPKGRRRISTNHETNKEQESTRNRSRYALHGRGGA